ncbi:MAG: 3-hydroxybutyryl-CoA dehydrogenase [Ktedonobacterales bacterium]|jgi:3-hydroxybutyryl-CoA dehydrogenase|nr:MAG: 3-hydroxybutyryl-CoA dehydrogenase [Ktedonobacterales bacterium]
MAIKKVGIIGGGLMGSGIAQVTAQAGYDVLLNEVNQELLDKGMARVTGAWDMLTGKGKITAEQAAGYRGHIRGTLDLAEFADCDLIIEAIIENLDHKRDLFAKLEGIAKRDALLASNTSSLPIIEMAAVTTRQDRVIGLHFFNPVPLMKLVEVIRSIATSDQTIEELRQFAISVGKTPIIAKDTAGFVVNFLLIPYMLAAIRMYENGIATKEDIDTGMKLGCGYPMGPFELLDYVGLDTTLYAAEAIYKEYPDPAYAPPTLLRRMVQAGRYGKKNGKGFYVGADDN